LLGFIIYCNFLNGLVVSLSSPEYSASLL